MSLKDAVLVGVIPAAALFAWSTSEPRQERIARHIARIRQILSRDRAGFARLVESIGGRQGFGEAPESIVDAYFANLYLLKLLVLQGHGPGGWQPETRLSGLAHLEAALAEKRGAILWLADFVFTDLPAFSALARGGHRFVVLSRYAHGFSTTQFGIRFLNPIEWRFRRRFSREILVIGPDGRIGHRKPLDVLSERLRANRIVTIRAYDAGTRAATIPVRDGTARIATGPLALAQRTGAAVLPVWTIRRPGGGFETTIEAPLDLHHGEPAAAIERSLACYAALHERFVSAHPDQFQWHRAYARDA